MPRNPLCMVEECQQQQQLAGVLLVRELLPPFFEQLNCSVQVLQLEAGEGERGVAPAAQQLLHTVWQRGRGPGAG